MIKQEGLVLEAGDNWAVIVNKRGEYKKIRTKAILQVGEIWQEHENRTIKFAIAAAILIVFLGVAYGIFPVVAYAQVSSGIELGLNRWEWVVSARPLNDDGRKVLQEVNLRGKTLDKAVELIVGKTLIYSNVADKEITLNVVTKNPKDEQTKQRILKKMNARVRKVLNSNDVNLNPDMIKGSKNIEPGVLNNEEKTNEQTLYNRDGRFFGGNPIDEGQLIKDNQQMIDKDTTNKDNDKTYQEQNLDKKDEKSKTNRDQNFDASESDDKTIGKDKDKAEKEDSKTNINP